MRFGDLLIQNFMGIGGAQVSLGARGLVNVAGVNEDDSSASSNGAGKSSFGDAISWCLFGKTARGDTGDAVVNEKAGKGTFVRLALVDGAETWYVTRHRKHKVGKNALHLHHVAGGVTTDLTQGTDLLTQAKLEAILGCSYEVFVGSVYAGQEQMPDLPAMTDKSLKVLVEEAAGTTLLEKGHRLALDAVQAAKLALSTATQTLDLAEGQFVGARMIVRETKERQTEWEAGRAGRVAPLKANARDAVRHAQGWAEATKHIDRAARINEIATADAAIKGVDGEKAELARLDKEAWGAKTQRATRGQDLAAIEGEMARLQRELDDLDHKVGCPCTGCQRPYTAVDIEPAKAAVRQELILRKGAASLARAARDAAENVLQSATKARDAFAAGMTDVASAIAARDAASRAVRELDDAERNQRDWTARAKERLAEATRAMSEPNPFDKALVSARERAHALNQATADALAAVKRAEEELQVAHDVCTVFAPSGVRAHILDTVTPFLNDRTARYLGTLSDGNIAATWSTLTKGAKGDLKEKFAIEVSKDLGGKRFSSLSGGEKRKVRVACALALQDLVASRASKPIELFVGDEIDDALDPAGVERLMGVLTEKARERGSVFVISHHSLKDWIPQTIIFVRKGGISTIQEVA